MQCVWHYIRSYLRALFRYNSTKPSGTSLALKKIKERKKENKRKRNRKTGTLGFPFAVDSLVCA